MSKTTYAAVATAVVAAAVIVGFLWLRKPEPQIRIYPPEAAVEQPAAAPAAPASEPPAIQYPIEATAEAALPALDRSDKPIASALASLLGEKAMAKFIQTDGFVRQVVATVDALSRAQAAPRLWPVNPTAGRFSVSGPEADKLVSADNGQRYAPLLVLAESVKTQHLAAIYIRFYPLFQQAYEELGYPGKYFNDRLVTVIDHLLAAPEPAGPVHVTLTEVKGAQRQREPWLHYEFADPELQDLSSGQKLLVRMGPGNERRAKAKLKELRAAVTGPQIREQQTPAPASSKP